MDAETRRLRQRLCLAFEHAPVGMLVRDIGAGAPHANQACFDLLGYGAGDAGLAAALLPEAGAPETLLDAQLLAGQRDAYRVERRYRHRQGHTVWCKADVSLVRAADGRPGFVVSVFEEITERNHAERAARLLAGQHRRMLDAVGWGVCGVGRDASITFVNPAAAAMLGRGAAQLVGQPVSVLRAAPGVADGWAVCGALRDGLIRHADNDHFRRADGASFGVEYTVMPLVEDGEVNGAVILFAEFGARSRA